MNFINKIGKYNKFDELHEFIINLVNDNLNIVNEYNQLAIQYATDSTWTNCMGHDKGTREIDFCKTLPNLLNTPIDDFLNNVPYKLYRSRIFVAPPKGQCYSVHKDPTKKLHLPISTNPKSYFLSYEPDEIRHKNMAADGTMYIIDTRRTHTFFNDGKTLRIHLVGSLIL
jgi:hypothetical protein